MTPGEFTPGNALLGGALIGLGLAGMLIGAGRIAGVSGVLGDLVGVRSGERSWRVFFVIGMLVTGFVFALSRPSMFDEAPVVRSVPLVALAGLLVGFGTGLGRGCTSGHGICGTSRLSVRSIAATLTFMATGIATAILVGAIGGR